MASWVEALGIWLPDIREDFLEELGLGLGRMWIVDGKAYQEAETPWAKGGR